MVKFSHNHSRDDKCSDGCPVYLMREAARIQQEAAEAGQAARRDSVPVGLLWAPDAYVRGNTGSGSGL